MKNFGLVVIGAHFGVWLEDLITNNKDKNILLIEPVPYNYKILQNKFSKYINISICTNAVFSENKKKKFYFVKENSISKLGKHWASGIGSFQKQHILDHYSKRFQITEEDIEVIEIEFITFENLVNTYGIKSIDNLQIDVEGAEFEILNSINFKKINIKYLVEKKNFVLINKKFKYDLVLVPFFNSLDQIDLLNKKILIPFKKIISKHIVLVTKKPLIKNFYYSEQGDNYFDRIQIKKIKNFYFLTARIAKNFKKKSKSFFIKNFSLLNNVELYYSNINSYINYFRNKDQIKKLKKVNSKKIKIMNTSQLYDSIIKYFF